LILEVEHRGEPLRSILFDIGERFLSSPVFEAPKVVSSSYKIVSDAAEMSWFKEVPISTSTKVGMSTFGELISTRMWSAEVQPISFLEKQRTD
jgi:hypothetical protein